MQAINLSGPLFLANGNTVNGLKAGDIAYISCENGDYTGTIGSGKTVDIAAGLNPTAMIFYSTSAIQCTYSSSSTTYPALYTMTDANRSSAVLSALTSAGSKPPGATIQSSQGPGNATSNGGGGGGDSGGNSILGHSPTTAVAMIILYSITGIITALFLIIIVVGAVRAHRHPERYGPRRIAGRPRQSRAKGIARAMLETLPIVKFGETNEQDKPAEQTRDIEMSGAASTEANQQNPGDDDPR